MLNPTTIRLNAEDKAALAELAARLTAIQGRTSGSRAICYAIRLALRTLDAQGITERRQTVMIDSTHDPSTVCIYCHREVSGTGEEQTPAVDDNDAWAEMAHEHEPHCKWIESRAHRINCP